MACIEEGPLGHPTDFSVAGILNNELSDYLAEHIPILAREAQAKYANRSSYMQQTLQGWQDDLDSLQGQIDDRRAVVEASESDQHAALRRAQEGVRDAQTTVNGLQDKVSSIQGEIGDLEWFMEWEAIPLGVELAAVEASYLVATAALDTAQAALSLAQDGVDAEQILDPELDTLIVEKATAKVALEAGMGVVSVAESVVDNIIKFVAEAAEDAIRLFDPEHISISGSLAQIRQHDLGHITVEGNFVGQHVNFDVEVNLNTTMRLAHGVWSWISGEYNMGDTDSAVTLIRLWNANARLKAAGEVDPDPQKANEQLASS